MPLELTDEERRWLTGLAEFDKGNRLAFMAICAGFGEPGTYLDVGCGTGAMVFAARALGVDAWGVDILPSESPYIYKRNLEDAIDLGRAFDLVTSIEVAEHIRPERADILCDTYARHLRPGGLFVLTAAAPGQLGDNHVNCQDKAYWRDRLQSRGLHYEEWATRRLFTMWEQTHWATHWCEQNLQVFTR